MMKEVDIKRTDELLKLKRRKVRVAVGMLTGHGCLNKYLKRIGKIFFFIKYVFIAIIIHNINGIAP